MSLPDSQENLSIGSLVEIINPEKTQLQLWDSKVRSLYSSSLGLVNDGVESYRGYGWIQTALDVC